MRRDHLKYTKLILNSSTNMQKRVTRGFGNVCRIVEISPQNAPKIIFNQNKDNKKIQLDLSILEEKFLLVLFEMIC